MLAAPHQRAPATARGQTWTLGVACLAIALMMFNVAAPNVALEEVARDLGASFVELQWVLGAYALGLAVPQLAGGDLVDAVGHRRAFLGGIAAFALASAACAGAPTPLLLIAGRAAQGIAASVVFSGSLALLNDDYPDPDGRRHALAIWGAVVGLAFALGPVLGALLTDGGGWRAPFAATSAFALLALAVSAVRVRPACPPPRARRIDLPGLLLLSAGLLCLVLALLEGERLGWGSATIVALAGGAVLLLGGFVAVERRIAHPLVDLRLFGDPTFAGATVAMLALGASTFSMFVYLTLYRIVGYGATPLAAGAQLAPLALTSFAVALLADRFRRRLAVGVAIGCGLACCGVGSLLLAVAGGDAAWPALLPGLLVSGIGVGLANPLIIHGHLAAMPADRGGFAAAVNNTARQLGITIGIAGLGAVGVGAAASAGALARILVVAGAVAFGGAIVAVRTIRVA
jgi:MFS family permease